MSDLILMLSAAHPPDDVRIVAKEGAALAAAGHRVMHLAPGQKRDAEHAPEPSAHRAMRAQLHPMQGRRRRRARRKMHHAMAGRDPRA